jgi:hypothetical protein
MMRALPILLFAIALPVRAQDQEIQKQLIQRQQQSDAFTLQLRQSQEALKAPPAAKPELETRQLSDRQRLENLSTKQQIEIKPDAPQELRPYERQKAEDERRPLTVPSGGIVQPPDNAR